MADIVDRLREMVSGRLQGHHDPAICAELRMAADEIDRLRASLLEIRALAHHARIPFTADLAKIFDVATRAARVAVSKPGETP